MRLLLRSISARIFVLIVLSFRNIPRIVDTPISVAELSTSYFSHEQHHRRLPLVPPYVPPTYPIGGHTATIPWCVERRTPYHAMGHVDRHSVTLRNLDIPEPRFFQSAIQPAPSYRAVSSVRPHAPQWSRSQTYVGQTLILPVSWW